MNTYEQQRAIHVTLEHATQRANEAHSAINLIRAEITKALGSARTWQEWAKIQELARVAEGHAQEKTRASLSAAQCREALRSLDP